ncbi:MAG TPA: prolipoprotein diacylglyceryl transferase family protein [Polyangiaceae bacterium]
MSPLIPYLELPELPILPAKILGGFPEETLTLKPFGMLVALGAYTGTVAALRQARRLGSSPSAVLSLTGWVAVSALVFAHVFDAIFYYPHELLADPLLIVRLWEGLSSFGGFAGAFIGAFAWRAFYKVELLPYADIIASSFPISMALGRFGCTVAHDHPGLRSDFFLAVKYPDGGRHDLGFYEFLIAAFLASAFLLLRRRPRPWGFYGGVMCSVYAPLRFLLDFLRERSDVAPEIYGGADARYVGLTPAQWACVPLFAVGITLLVRMRGRGHELPLVPVQFGAAVKPPSGVDRDRPVGDARDEG